MHHQTYLLALFAQDRRRHCPCGAVAERPYGLCRKCQARNAWRRKTTFTRRRAARRRIGPRTRNVARLLSDAMSLFPSTSKARKS